MSQRSPARTRVEDVQAIDAHAHYGIYKQEKIPPIKNRFMSGDAATVVGRARRAHTEWTIVSPLLGLMPRFKAEKRLGHPKCMGIKIHPEEHGFPIRKYGREIFGFAARHRAIVLTHSGEQNSLPADFVPFANDFPEARLILAHLGCGWDGDPTHQVRAIQASKRGNVYVDTSSAQSIMAGLIEFGVRELGAERLLYGTDTPLYFAGMQRARIDQADIRDAEKRLILRENALRLFGAEKFAAAAQSERKTVR